MLLTTVMILLGLILLALQRYIKKRLFGGALFIWGFGLVIVASLRLDFYSLSTLWTIVYLLGLFVVATLIHFMVRIQIIPWAQKYPDWICVPE